MSDQIKVVRIGQKRTTVRVKGMGATGAPGSNGQPGPQGPPGDLNDGDVVDGGFF